MNFKYLSEIGEHYDSEEGGSGVRTDPRVWKGIEAKLKKAITDLRSLVKNPTALPALPAPGTGITALKNFHMAKQQQFAPGMSIEEARRKVDYFRKWLAAEGASADKDGNIEWGKLKDLKVVYDHDLAKQGMTKIHFTSGRLFTDAACTIPLSTEKMVTHFSGPGKAIFVMGAAGNIHVSSHVVGNRHHSSLLAGDDVACAGELQATAGILEWLSNKSGHYMPKVSHLLQVLHVLQKNTVPMVFSLKVLSASGAKDYDKVGDFLAEMELNEEPDYELEKLFAYSAHLEDSILNLNGWRWRHPPQEKPGVYTLATNQFVPHGEVRKWLKSQGKYADVSVQSGMGR